MLRGKHKGRALAAYEALRKLIDDDSRRVARAAGQCLASYAEQERQERETAEAAERERQAREQAEQERLRREEAEQERLKAEAERAAQEKAEQEQQERARAEAAERERQAKEQAERERLAREEAARERLKAEAERAAQEKAEQERQERERAEAAERERQAKEQAERERLAREEAARERLKAEAERAAREKAEQERQEHERAAERERQAKEQAERERLEREEAERERLKAEAEREAQEKTEQERQRERSEGAERERQAKEQAERERLARERAEQDRLKAEAERAAQEKAEQERQERERSAALERERRGGEGVQEEPLALARAESELPRLHVAVGPSAPVWGAGPGVGVGVAPAKTTAPPVPTPVPAPEGVVPSEPYPHKGKDRPSIPSAVIEDEPKRLGQGPVLNQRTKVHVNPWHPTKEFVVRYWPWLASAVVIVAVSFGLWLQSVGRYIAKGNSYYTKRAYEEALRTYQIGLHRHPGNSVLQEKIKQTLDAIARKNQIDALIKQGDSYYARGAYGESIRKYQEALALDPENPVLQEKIQRAQDALKKQVSDLIKQGDSYYASGACDKAIGEYRKGLSLAPENSFLQERIQRACSATPGGPSAEPPRHSPPASPHVDPNKIAAAIALGDIYYNRAEYDMAIAEYKKGLRLEPSNRDLRNRLQRAQASKAAQPGLSR